MNKHIKLKKDIKLQYKESFSKEDRIFIKKYPRLYIICITFNIPLRVVNKNKKKLKRVKIVKKDMFEIMYQALIVAKKENYNYRIGSRGDYYKTLFKEANIII